MRGQFFEVIAPKLSSATINALSKLKSGVRFIAIGEVIRRYIAKCIARDAKLKPLFNTKQLILPVKAAGEGIAHAKTISVEILQKN